MQGHRTVGTDTNGCGLVRCILAEIVRWRARRRRRVTCSCGRRVHPNRTYLMGYSHDESDIYCDRCHIPFVRWRPAFVWGDIRFVAGWWVHLARRGYWDLLRWLSFRRRAGLRNIYAAVHELPDNYDPFADE